MQQTEKEALRFVESEICEYYYGPIQWYLQEYQLDHTALSFVTHNHPYKSHDHDHQWADLVIFWLSQDKTKREHNIARLVRHSNKLA